MATGLEIVGVVLAVIPLAISALEHYEDGVSTIEKFFRYKREIRSIIESLSTENVMFKNSCEHLLSDFLSPVELADMLQNPRGETWVQPHVAAQLQVRLDRSYDIYMIHVGNMDSAIRKLVKRLDLDENGKVRWTDLKGFKKLVKKGKLALSRSAYQDLLLKMRECNRAISTLTEQNQKLLPSRQSRSRSDRFRTIRDGAKDVYKALCSSFSCSCVSHSVNWQLDVPREQSSTPFRIITMTEALEGDSLNSEFSKEYREIELRPAKEVKLDPKLEMSLMPLPATRNSKIKKTLRFADTAENSQSSVLQFGCAQSISSSTTTLTQGSTSTLVGIEDHSISTEDPQSDLHIDNLCHKLSKFDLKSQMKFLGYLSASDEARYEVIALNSWQIHAGKRPSLSLASLLSQTRTTSETILSLHDRFQLAKSIATGVLQLYNSPLLQSTWTKEDIIFVHRADKPYRKAYISKPIRLADEVTHKRKAVPYIQNPTIFSLGILLIEICLACTLSNLRTQDDCDSEVEFTNPTMATDYATAMRLLDTERILVESGEPYADAVKRCITCNFGTTKVDLEDDSFRQAVYSGVVAPLEEQVKTVLGALGI